MFAEIMQAMQEQPQNLRLWLLSSGIAKQFGKIGSKRKGFQIAAQTEKQIDGYGSRYG